MQKERCSLHDRKRKSNSWKNCSQENCSCVGYNSCQKKAHQKDLDILIQKARDNYNSRYSELVKKTGGQIMGPKHIAKKAKLERLKTKEATGK